MRKKSFKRNSPIRTLYVLKFAFASGILRIDTVPSTPFEPAKQHFIE